MILFVVTNASSGRTISLCFSCRTICGSSLSEWTRSHNIHFSIQNLYRRTFDWTEYELGVSRSSKTSWAAAPRTKNPMSMFARILRRRFIPVGVAGVVAAYVRSEERSKHSNDAEKHIDVSFQSACFYG